MSAEKLTYCPTYCQENHSLDPEAVEMTEDNTPIALLLALDSTTDVVQHQRQDKYFSNIIRVLLTEDMNHPKYNLWVKSFLIIKNTSYRAFPTASSTRRVLCLPESLRDAIFQEIHANSLTHLGS